MKFYTRYAPPKIAGKTFPPSLTKQSFKDECDVNSIMDRYARTGVLGDPSDLDRPQIFADIFDQVDFRTIQESILDAKHAFMSIPAKLRDRFGNDPAKLIEYLQDPENDIEAVKLGLKVSPELEDVLSDIPVSNTPKKGEKTADIPAESTVTT